MRARHRIGTRFALEISEYEGKGRGVRTLETIRRGATIEIAPAQFLSPSLCRFIMRSRDYAYFFVWKDNNNFNMAIGLGLLSLCNHSRSPNARVDIHTNSETAHLVAIQKIEPRTEITLSYLASPKGMETLHRP